MRDDLEVRLAVWLQDGPEQASGTLVDATFAGEKTDALRIPDGGLRLTSDRVLQRQTLLPP